MCGIAGWAGDVGADTDTLERMCQAISHRGPDEQRHTIAAQQVGLGFRRLSIIDLETGSQPLQDERGAVLVTCNGEIYNFRELRSDLERRGHRFASRSDTETIAHLYEERGPACVESLQGMFAIALWDADQQRLMLARDRLGVKPLYWAPVDGGLLYGSEPRAILASGLIRPSPDPQALMQYLTLQYVPAPRSGFRGINKLAPGERLLFENGRTRIDRYWDLDYTSADGELTDADALTQLDDLLGDATRSRLVADVPLGAFLSGGIDSSLVVSYMAEALAEVRTFSIDFAHARFSEGQQAREVAQLFGTTHEEFTVEPSMVPVVADVVSHMGEPFADSSAIPTFLLSEMTRRQVTVALSGDGGDEAFAGYPRHLLATTADRFDPLSRALGRGARAALPRKLTVRSRYADRALEALVQTPHDRYAGMLTQFPPPAVQRLCRPDFLSQAGGATDAWDRILRLPALRGVNRYLALDTATYLPGDILAKVDRTSMAHGLEVRSPFLDYRVYEFAAGLPERLKLRGRRTKYLLRALAAQRGLPERVSERPKQGFGVPIGEWFRSELREWLDDVLGDPRTRARDYFHYDEVDRLVAEHREGVVDHAPRLWNLATLELWHRAWIDGG